MSKKDLNKTKLSMIAHVTQGQSPESTYYSDSEGVPFLQWNRTFGNLYPFYDTFTKKITKMAKEGEVLMSIRAPVWDLNLAPSDLCIGRWLASIRALDGDNKFVYYALKYNVKNLIKQWGATTFDSVNKDIINNFELVIPEDVVMRWKISDLLATMDSKIELNNKLNIELETMTRTLYEYWFVQFDFPNENGKPYKSSGGEMVWNQELKRDIPKWWWSDKMISRVNLDKSGDWWKEDPEWNHTKKVLCIRWADINGLNGKDSFNPPVRYILEKNSGKILQPHDIIIEISGWSPTQSTWRLTFITSTTLERLDAPAICSNFCRPISLKNEKFLYNFVFHWNRLYDSGAFFWYEWKTSWIKNLLLETFMQSHSVVVPPIWIVEDFYEIMQNFQKKKQTVIAENQELSTLRDWLLPMLMNGQVTVD